MGTWIVLGFFSVATISCTIYYFRYRGYSRWPTVPGTIEALIAIHSLGGSPVHLSTESCRTATKSTVNSIPASGPRLNTRAETM